MNAFFRKKIFQAAGVRCGEAFTKHKAPKACTLGAEGSAPFDLADYWRTKVPEVRVVGPKLTPLNVAIVTECLIPRTLTKALSDPLVSVPARVTLTSTLLPLMLSWPSTRTTFGVRMAEIGKETFKIEMEPSTPAVTPRAVTEPVALALTSNVGVMIASTRSGVVTKALALAVALTETLPEAFSVIPTMENVFVPVLQVFENVPGLKSRAATKSFV